jgi:hypothetical protein
MTRDLAHLFFSILGACGFLCMALGFGIAIGSI